MGVCETVMDEDEENFSIATAKDFKAHGAPLLMLLPQEARLPLMNIACMYMEELDTDPYMWGDADSEDDEDDEEIEEGDEEQQVRSLVITPRLGRRGAADNLTSCFRTFTSLRLLTTLLLYYLIRSSWPFSTLPTVPLTTLTLNLTLLAGGRAGAQGVARRRGDQVCRGGRRQRRRRRGRGRRRGTQGVPY